MTTSEYDQPSKLKRVSGAAAGVVAGASIYGAGGFFAYAAAEICKTGIQSPDVSISTISVLCTVAIAAIGLIDLTQKSGEGIRSVLTSGVRAGIAVNQAILNE
jgi:hypothetical protein